MAGELELNIGVRYDDGDTSDFFDVIAALLTSGAKKKLRATQTIGFAAAEALILGEITSPIFLAMKNLDPTNFVTVLTGTGGVVFAKLLPGVPLAVPLGSGAQAPYVQADTAACKIDYLVVAA